MNEIRIKLKSLVIFRNLLNDPVVSSFMNIVNSPCEDAVDSYCEFLSKLFEKNTNFSEYILDFILNDINFFAKMYIYGDKTRERMIPAAKEELKIISSLASVTSADIKAEIDCNIHLHDYETTDIDFEKVFFNRMEHISETGYGIYAKYHMFVFENNIIQPVKSPDDIMLSKLGGYERERKLLIDNTEAFLQGKPAANALLYGHSGTGKSSTVKAIANEFKDKGLRIIEVKKDGIKNIPQLADMLAQSPLKFIIFIDDLSFGEDEESFSSMKAVLEGSVSKSASNMIIYATSNRRHMIKETFDDRRGSEIHITDSIEEKTSLAERFGLRIVFSKPDKNLYCDIVRHLAKEYGIDEDDGKLIELAERYALARGGRSARAAKQFIDCIACGITDF